MDKKFCDLCGKEIPSGTPHWRISVDKAPAFTGKKNYSVPEACIRCTTSILNTIEACRITEGP